MVSILPNDARTGFDVLAKHFSQGVQNSLPQQYENQKFQRGMSAIDKLQESLKPQNGRPIDQGEILANLARVQAQLPGFERSPYMEYVMKHAGSEAMKNAPRAGEDIRDRSEMPRMESRQQLPEFGQTGSPKGVIPGLEQGIGNVSQQATTGIKEKLLNPREQVAAARELNNVQKAAGLNVDLNDSLKEVKEHEIAKKIHNDAVDEELKKRVAGEKEYGARGAEYLKKYYKNPSPELEAYFQKKGEEASKQGKSEASINAYLADEARDLGNAMKNITDSPTALRSYNKIGRALNGTYRNFDESAEDLRKNMQPLLDAGLYDLARKQVTNLGYYPEEREIIVNPLSMGVQSAMNELPKIADFKSGNLSIRSLMPPPDLQPLKEVLMKAKSSDDNFSLVLGRKIAEDKGYDWNNYKNALNELENEGFQLTPDQKNHRGELDEPPVSLLSGFLQGMGITGR